jgi:hypothetical protein
MSSPQGSSDQQAGGSAAGGSSGITPRSASRFETWQDAHRVITGQTSSDIAEHEFLPDPSVHEDDVDEEPSQDTTTLEERQRQEQAWFDEAFLAASASDEPPSGEEVLVSAGETDTDERAGNRHTCQADREESHDIVGEILDQYAGSETQGTATSSGFNPALASVQTSASNRSASVYRAAPEERRRDGAAGRLGFHGLYQSSFSSGPSGPLPIDPPVHAGRGEGRGFPDQSVSSVTNSQALLYRTLSSPPARAYQPGHRVRRHNIPAMPPPVPRRSSRREQSRGNTRVNDPRFAALFGPERQPSPFRDIDEDEEWGDPGPAVVRGVIVEDHPRDVDPLSSNAAQSTLTVPQEGASASTSRSTSALPESSGSSARDPFHYDRLFLPPDEERVVTSRLRTMTGDATVFSQSPLNSPDRVQEFDDVALNETATTPSRPSSTRRQEATTIQEGDPQLFRRAAREQDRSMALGRCHCQFPWYECRLCAAEQRDEEERRMRQGDSGPYVASPSYRMDSRGVCVAGQDSGETAFYIGNSPEGHSSTELILARPGQHGVTSPSNPARALERSDFTTFRPVQRNHRVNGRDENSPDVPNFSHPPPRRPTLETYRTAPAAYLGQSGSSRSRFEFRDSVHDAPQQSTQQQGIQQPLRSDNWRSLTHQQDQTVTSQDTDFDRRATSQDIAELDRRNRTLTSPYSNDPNSPTQFGQFTFPLLPLDEARRRQAEARSRGDVDQTFISSSTATRRTHISVGPTSSINTVTHGGPFSAFIAQAERAQRRASELLPGRRRRAITRTTGQGDSFSSVMRAALEYDNPGQQNLGAEATPHAFLPGTMTATTTTAGNASSSAAAPPTLHPPPRTFPSSSRYGNIRDDDVELVPYGTSSAGAGIVAAETRGSTALGRRWSA